MQLSHDSSEATLNATTMKATSVRIACWADKAGAAPSGASSLDAPLLNFKLLAWLEATLAAGAATAQTTAARLALRRKFRPRKRQHHLLRARTRRLTRRREDARRARDQPLFATAEWTPRS